MSKKGTETCKTEKVAELSDESFVCHSTAFPHTNRSQVNVTVKILWKIKNHQNIPKMNYLRILWQGVEKLYESHL